MTNRIHLIANGVSLVLLVDEGRLPEVTHWGAALGGLSQEAFDAVALGSVFPVGPSSVDAVPRYTLLLEARYGWMGKPGLIASREGRDWTPAWTTTGVTCNGEAVGEFVEAGPGTVEFQAEAPGLSLVITVELTVQGLVRMRARVTNAAGDPLGVNEFTLGLPVPASASELLDFSGRWGVERVPQRRAFTVGQHRREGRRGRPGADAAYVLHAGEPGFGFRSGEVWSVHSAFSGNQIHLAEADSVGFHALSGGELLLPGEVRLAEGESYETPWVVFNYGQGLDAQADRFHGWLRALPHAPSTARPVTLNVWEAVYFDHDANVLVDLAERAARVGIERYVLDDGWFGARRNDQAGLGDWVVSTEVWPDGLHPLVDRVKDLGMEFGLWFEPEMVNLDSDVARAHPEWIMQPEGRLPLPARSQHVLNLSIPGAWQHVFRAVDAILTEYRIDYVKWDHNRDLLDAGTSPQGRPAVHAQTMAFYALLDALRERHPHVEFESCSSGGARIDLEVMTRAERVWVSDVSDPEERQRMLVWTGQLLPPEFMGSHIAAAPNHITGRWHDLSFRAATAVFGHLGVEWNLAAVSDDELGQLAEWIDWFKANRHVLLGGMQVRMDMPHPDVYFKGVVTPEKAIYSLSTLRTSGQLSAGMLRFAGLDPAAAYRVTVVDRQPIPPMARTAWTMSPHPVELSGHVLMTAGLRAPLLLPSTAVIFELDRV